MPDNNTEILMKVSRELGEVSTLSRGLHEKMDSMKEVLSNHIAEDDKQRATLDARLDALERSDFKWNTMKAAATAIVVTVWTVIVWYVKR